MAFEVLTALLACEIGFGWEHRLDMLALKAPDILRREMVPAIPANFGIDEDGFCAVRALLGLCLHRDQPADRLRCANLQRARRRVTPLPAVPILLAAGRRGVGIPARWRQAGSLSAEEELDDDAYQAEQPAKK